MKKAGDPDDPLKSAWFVPARDLDDYTEDERVYDRDDEGRRKLRVHPRGRFIYRLAGRDRQKTASYYTPESLTRCVVKYALRELINDDNAGRPHPRPHRLRARHGVGRVPERGREPARREVPGAQAARVRPADSPRGVRR